QGLPDVYEPGRQQQRARKGEVRLDQLPVPAFTNRWRRGPWLEQRRAWPRQRAPSKMATDDDMILLDRFRRPRGRADVSQVRLVDMLAQVVVSRARALLRSLVRQIRVLVAVPINPVETVVA